jgi:hypothetical protein
MIVTAVCVNRRRGRRAQQARRDSMLIAANWSHDERPWRWN